jgi:hypothetical protein
LGQGFASLCGDALIKGEDPKPCLPKDLFGVVSAEWQRRLVDYVSVLESDGNLDKLISQLPEMGDGSYRMKWSSMLLGGIYNERERALDILSIGDCGAVVVGEKPQIVATRETCGIILATLTPANPIKVDVFSVQVDSVWEHFEGVTDFIAMSDGVSKDLDGLLTKLRDSLSGGNSIGNIRARLIAERALTYDDRAMIIGRLLPCEEKARVRVTLRDGSQTHSFQFVEPSAGKWSNQNSEYLAGVRTGLPAPFDRVFVKRVSRAAVTGHNLLVKLTGRTLPASPRVYGIYQNGDTCLYFFQNLPASFRTLDEQLDNINVITPQLVRGVITKASGIFKVIERCGFVYIDFCAKNIMLDRESGGLAIIDIDSSWPATFLRNKKPDNQGQIEFWGLWNHTLSACIPVRVENAQKSVLLSFAAVLVTGNCTKAPRNTSRRSLCFNFCT